GINISGASLVWEDAENLIDPKSIKLVDEGNAIEFEIPAEHIDQGNAVIAAMDGSNVAWNWHIWVTDEKASLAEPVEDQNKYGESINFMPLTLGWCSTSKASGAVGREYAVRISMPGHLTSKASFRIRQNSTPSKDISLNTDGNSTYYNWGRKDPFPGAASTNKAVGVDEAVLSHPKAYYQVDGASMGLHAEMHADYGAKWWALTAQGAVIGLDGFLTGRAIVQFLKFFKNPIIEIIDPKEKYSAIQPPIQELFYEEEFAEQQFVTDMVMHHGEGVALSEEARELFPKNWYAVTTDESYRWMGKGVAIVDADTKEFVLHFRFLHGGMLDGIKYVLCNVKLLENAATITVGNWSQLLLASASGRFASLGFVLGNSFVNSSMFNGNTEWCKEMKSHGVPLNYATLHPNILLRDPISWVNHDGVGNLWNAGQTKYDDKDCAVVKSIYDPCPAGYCVPTARDMGNFDDSNTFSSYQGATGRTSSSQKIITFPALGFRSYWSASEPGAAAVNDINDLFFLNGSQGMYWTSSPAINQDKDDEKGAYAVNFRGLDSYQASADGSVEYYPRVMNGLKLQQSYALPIRPVREK
ncbi:MAG: hypothetical protein HUJ94_07910, partial [Bacteroidales bacterium]|nr:hypothetical protein [Bacteroidales bacterium]